jgi:hypothetical protein
MTNNEYNTISSTSNYDTELLSQNRMELIQKQSQIQWNRRLRNKCTLV